MSIHDSAYIHELTDSGVRRAQRKGPLGVPDFRWAWVNKIATQGNSGFSLCVHLLGPRVPFLVRIFDPVGIHCTVALATIAHPIRPAGCISS